MQKYKKSMEKTKKMGKERLKEQILGLSIPLLLQLKPLGIYRFLLQVVGKAFPAGKEVLEERVLPSLESLRDFNE